MNTIIYDSRIDWNALKQRPQYLAEELSNKYRIIFTCMKLYKRKTINEIHNTNLIVKHFNHVPFLDRNSYTKRINNILRMQFYKHLIKQYHPSLIILSDVTKINIIRHVFNGPIIYDCMDDFISFGDLSKSQREEILRCEERVINESVVTIVSSIHLLDTVSKRYGKKINKKLMLVRNGCDTTDLPVMHNTGTKEHYTLCYFGTIGAWFDVNILKKSLNDFDNIAYLIIGNVKPDVIIPSDPRIKVLGAVPHNQLASIIKDCDAFVMPFLINDVVLSVDPVKLYEYISLDKNILCVQYPEVDRFDEYVYFYKDYDTYKKQLINMINNREIKYNMQQRNSFLQKNSWHSRAEQLVNVIDQYI